VAKVKIIECPRDAWQGLPIHIPTEVKADYLRLLIAAGFKHIDAVSFVSAAAVPQMADSEKVLDYLDPPDDTEIIANTREVLMTALEACALNPEVAKFNPGVLQT